MSLNTAKLKKDINQLLTDMLQRENNSIEEFSNRLGDMVQEYVKSGEVQVNKGIKVETVGTATKQSGATTEKGIGKIV